MNTQKGKISVLLAVLALSFLLGAVTYFIDIESGLFVALMLLYTAVTEIIILRWFIIDARERGYPLPKFAYVLFFLMTLIMIPIYFVETRGKSAWRPILLTFAFLALMFGANIAGQYSAEMGLVLKPKPVVRTQ